MEPDGGVYLGNRNGFFQVDPDFCSNSDTNPLGLTEEHFFDVERPLHSLLPPSDR